MKINEIIFSGYTPYPKLDNDDRLPYIVEKLSKRIDKTALGAQSNLNLSYVENIDNKILELKQNSYQIISLEQSDKSVDISEFDPSDKIVLIIGNELDGVSAELLDISDKIIEIPMLGKKESYNVASASAIALYHLRFGK